MGRTYFFFETRERALVETEKTALERADFWAGWSELSLALHVLTKNLGDKCRQKRGRSK